MRASHRCASNPLASNRRHGVRQVLSEAPEAVQKLLHSLCGAFRSPPVEVLQRSSPRSWCITTSVPSSPTTTPKRSTRKRNSSTRPWTRMRRRRCASTRCVAHDSRRGHVEQVPPFTSETYRPCGNFFAWPRDQLTSRTIWCSGYRTSMQSRRATTWSANMS